MSSNESLHVTPMGPVFDQPDSTTFILRPYEPSRTLTNLLECGEGVLHVVDDVLLIARSALRIPFEQPETKSAAIVRGRVLVDACHWYEFRVEDYRASSPRHEFDCRIVHHDHARPFWGFNRAKHAVLEATILATRTDFLPAQEILEQVAMLYPAVEKTAGPQEQLAWNEVIDSLQLRLGVDHLPKAEVDAGDVPNPISDSPPHEPHEN